MESRYLINQQTSHNWGRAAFGGRLALNLLGPGLQQASTDFDSGQYFGAVAKWQVPARVGCEEAQLPQKNVVRGSASAACCGRQKVEAAIGFGVERAH
jgi:hypothetical protein